MRLWSVHPKYLDRLGLLACWRESLLAQKVLLGQTVGYRAHPQLIRFRQQPDPLAAISTYLSCLAVEAAERGYHFDHSKFELTTVAIKIPLTRGQLLFEWGHLCRKLAGRSPGLFEHFKRILIPAPHPLFFLVEGPPESWEKTRSAG
jgi:hypothetical protein